ncbi:MAG: LamG-like jellyroll fold domain-containing protein [Candidatus Thorarchaeota archaeon]
MTVSAWVYLDDLGDERFIAKEELSGGGPHIWMLGHNGLGMKCRITTDGTGGVYTALQPGTNAFTLGGWYYAVMTWDAALASNEFKLYVNGSLFAQTNNAGETISDSSEAVTFADNGWNNPAQPEGNRWFNGSLDEARVSRIAHSADWISTQYANQEDPSSFYSVGAEQSVEDTWSDDQSVNLIFETSSPLPITMDIIMTMDIEGSGQTLDEEMNDGTTFYVANASVVQWTANVMVSPPAMTDSMGFIVNYPRADWIPISVKNPVGTVMTEGSDWDHSGGVLTIYAAAIDFWGAWTIEAESWNYVEELQLGISGQSLSDTATFNINDVMKVQATTPWIQNARAGLVLTDPDGTVWHTDYNTTGAAATTWDVPSFQYRMQLTIPAAQVDADVTNFPTMVSFVDSNLQKAQATGDDIVFVSNGEILDHDLERFDKGTGAIVAWVKANLSSSSANIITMYYGNPIVGPQENPSAVWSNGYDAVWHLDESVTDEASGGIHYDSTPGDYEGIQNGNGMTTSGIGSSYAQDFDGVDDWISVNATEGLEPAGDVTISGWIYLPGGWSSSETTSEIIVEKFYSNDDNMHIAMVGTDYGDPASPGSLAFGFESSNSEYGKYTSITGWATGWHHFACYMDSDTLSNSKIYIDGIDRTGGSFGSATSANLSYYSDWGIGGRYGETAEFPAGEAFFTGRIDEIRVTSGSRAAGWMAVEYDNVNSQNTFVLRGSEVQKTSPEHTFTKTIDSTAIAGLWTASVYYNDTGATVSYATGLYEREFIIKHDSSFSLIAPADAVSDRLTEKTAGDLLQLEIELTDDISAAEITGATVVINWTVGEVVLDEYGAGRYGKVMDTSDLGENKRWRINFESKHQYYNNATDYIDLDLSHETSLSYVNVDNVPIGEDLTATLVYWDVFDDVPITGASIAFSNGTPISAIDQGNGNYDVTLSSGGLGLGDHWLILNASHTGLLEDASTNVTFTIRKHFTSVSVIGDLITPSGQATQVTVVITDLDTGVELSSTADVTTWSFTSGYAPVTENSPSDFDVTLTTATWSLGTETVTLTVTMSGLYYSPTNYQFDLEIRKHHTTISIIGNLLTPSGQNTLVTIVIMDTDTGAALASTGAVTSWIFTSGYAPIFEASPADFDVTLTTSTWSIGTETVTLTVVLGGIYNNPSNIQFDVEIRKHYTSVTVIGDLITPQGLTTPVTVVITDLDTGTILGTTASVSSWTFNPASYTDTTETPPADFAVTLDTSSWSVGTDTVTFSVTMTGIYDNPVNYLFDIQIRNHRTALSVIGDFITPSGQTTPVTVVITDLDTNTVLATTGSVTSWSFTSGYPAVTETPPADFDVTLTTAAWSISIETVTLSVTMSGIYDNPSNIQFDITIRKHYTTVTVIGDLITPSGFSTSLTVVITDSDTGAVLSGTGSIASWTFNPASYTDTTETPPADFAVILDTSVWSVGTDTITLSVTMTGIYENPSNYIFDIEIRNHITSVSVSGSMVTPYGNTTPLTVTIVDLDTGADLSATTDVTSWSFTSTYAPITENSPADFDVILTTGSWLAGSEDVTLTVTMGGIYNNPSSYQFTITIRSMQTYLYHEPSDLIIPTDVDFNIVLQYNVSEPGTSYGAAITGLIQAEFTVENSTYTYPITIVELGSGRYNLTIAALYFLEGTYTIIVTADPVDSKYQTSQLVITFDYRPRRSDLTANLYTVSTPYNTNATVILYFDDLVSSTGITTAIITTSDTWISFVHDGDGDYTVTIGVASFGLGSNFVNLTADAVGYTARSVNITVIVTQIHTDAEPSVISLDMPVGSTKIFFIDYTDLDNSIPISGASIANNWTGSVSLDISWTGSQYRINFTTTGTDTLGLYVVWFNFTNGANYQPGYCEIEVDLRTHITIFNLVSAVEPTAFNGLINISVRYYDWDDRVGIDSGFVEDYVWNGTHWITTTLISEGGGFYLIQIDATQFNLGVQSFTIYFNWTGPVQQFENKTTDASVNIVGVDSKLTLLAASEPTPYLDNMTYTIRYAELGTNLGITNTSNPYGDGNVLIFVSFQGQSISQSQYDIWEINPATNAGEFIIQFNSSIFGITGLIYMNLFINWSQGVQPFYTNRTDTISVRILARDTLVSVVPASATPYGENATFSFTYEDSLIGADIANSSSLTITLSLVTYTLYYEPATKLFTVSFNTSQFGAPLEQKSFTLDVTWAGAPFYANRTGRTIYVTVTARQTVLDYQPPAPTPYGDNVTFTVTWNDVTGTSKGITSATLLLYDGGSLIPSLYYSVAEIGSGSYDIVLNTTYKVEPGLYSVNVTISSSDFFYLTTSASQTFNVRLRSTILTSEPIDTVPYNSSVEVVLYYQDLLTLTDIGNTSNLVTFVILTPGPWISSIIWQPAFSSYLLTIETYNQPALQIGVDITLELNMSYVYQNPFYRWDNAFITFQLRTRSSILEQTEAPIQTPYLEYANLTVYYSDADAVAGIPGALISILKGGVPLTNGVDFVYVPLGGGYYRVSVNTTALDGLGATTITIWANWTSGSPYHNNATLSLDLITVQRPTNVVVLVPPSQISYQENVTFTVAFSDLARDQYLSVTKSIVNVYNGVIQLSAGDFAFTQLGSLFNYEISIDSTLLTSVLITGLNLTVMVDWPNSPNYYQDDSTSLRVTIKSRDTVLSIDRPPRTAYGENATLTFRFIDSTNIPEILIANNPSLFVITNLTEAPSISYNSGTRVFTISFNTSQFIGIGDNFFYLNVTWVGSPFYANKTLQVSYVTVILRQTQVVLQAPAPTPYGDNVTFSVEYVDIAGAVETGIPDGTLTIYYSGSPVPTQNYDVVPDGQGNFEIEFYTGFFAQPGIYGLNVSIVYAGSYFRADAFAVRALNVRLRTTILSAEPVGQIGYETQMQTTLYFQDILTLVDIANTSSTSFLTILNNTGTPWVFTVQWQPATSSYLLVVDTAGQPLLLGTDYTLWINMSYIYQDPFYRWDDGFVHFSIRTRTSSLDIQEAPLPTPYGENATFVMYYWDADVIQGISGAAITLETSGFLTLNVDFWVIEGAGGEYNIYLDSAVLSTLTVHDVRVTAVWSGAPPYHDNAQRNVSVSVTRRTARVEIVSPATQPRFLDNMTFTFEFVDSIDGQLVTGITSSDIQIWVEGSLLIAGEFVMTETSSQFEVSINSTVLGGTLVSDLNLTILVDWNDLLAPFYTDDSTTMHVSTRGRSIFVEPQQIATTPTKDNMTISFILTDDDSNAPISGAIINFNCSEEIIQEGLSFWITEGSGATAGYYTILVDTAFLLTTGDFTFNLEVQWDPAIAPFYINRSVIQLTGSVDLIWANLQAEAPQPSSVQITGDIFVIVTLTDLDHVRGINGSTMLVTYSGGVMDGVVPQGLQVISIGTGLYNISFSTIDLNTFGSQALSITSILADYTSSTVTPTFSVVEISTVLELPQTSYTLNWSETASIFVDFRNLLFYNLTSGATITWDYGTGSDYFWEIGSTGTYQADIDTKLKDAGTHIVTITASKTKYFDAVITVTLVVLSLPSDITITQQITPTEVFDGEAVLQLPRGDPVEVVVYLNDTFNIGLLINWTFVNALTMQFENDPSILMVHNDTDGSWRAIIPSSATSDLEPNVLYTVRFTGDLKNFNPVSTIFKIYLQATATTIHLVDVVDGKLDAFYSANVTFKLTFNETISNATITNATIRWVFSARSIDYNFTVNNITGLWSLTIDTTELAYGTWGLTFRATPGDSKLGQTVATLTITIKPIPTQVTNPVLPPVSWGWVGNISFYLHDTEFDRGVYGANATYSWGDYKGFAIDLNNGTYLIPVDTTALASGELHRISIDFIKDNHEVSNGGVFLTVNEVPTELLLDTPELNWLDDDPSRLQIPLGEAITIRLFYNDTDNSDSFVGGLIGAENDTAIFGGGIATSLEFALLDLGNGTYLYIFDSEALWLYEIYEFNPQVPERGFTLRIGLQLMNRTSQELTITITIIERPTEFVFASDFITIIGENVGDLTMYYGESLEIILRYTEIWPTRSGIPVLGAILTGTSREFEILAIMDNGTSPQGNGYYFIKIEAPAPLLPIGLTAELVTIDIIIDLVNHESQVLTLEVTILPTEAQQTMGTVISLATPSLLLILMMVLLYVRVFSVPKRLRQINGQIKALRKGKMPKPIDGAKSRPELIAELFNDTYSGTDITRDAAQMPEESIPIDIPEMGELLVQLSILTHLSPEELDEFKEDIAKMKMSEQAAFVKEVINQEAIRAARREGKTVQQILEDLSAEANLRIVGEEEAEPVSLIDEELPEDRVILIDEEEEEVVEEEAPIIEDEPPVEDVAEDKPTPSEKLSQFEIEELKADLVKRGVPIHEIDTIIEQARDLPRELVEELIRSLGIDE